MFPFCLPSNLKAASTLLGIPGQSFWISRGKPGSILLLSSSYLKFDQTDALTVASSSIMCVLNTIEADRVREALINVNFHLINWLVC